MKSLVRLFFLFHTKKTLVHCLLTFMVFKKMSIIPSLFISLYILCLLSLAAIRFLFSSPHFSNLVALRLVWVFFCFFYLRYIELPRSVGLQCSSHLEFFFLLSLLVFSFWGSCYKYIRLFDSVLQNSDLLIHFFLSLFHFRQFVLWFC